MRASAASDEAEQHSGATLVRRTVEGDSDGAVEADGLAGEAFFAPEGMVVDDVDLRVGAHRRALGKLIAQDGKQGFVVDARGERRRNRDDHLLGGNAPFVEVDLHALGVLR